MKHSITTHLLCSILALAALLLASCGGDNSYVIPAAYTGATTQAVVTSGNAEQLAVDAYDGGNDVNNLIVAPQAVTTTAAPSPEIRKLTGLLGAVANTLGNEPAISPLATGVVTYTGACGGDYTSTFTTATSSAWGTIVFNSYCENGVTLDGTMSFHRSTTSTGVTKLTMTFDDLQSTDSGGSLKLNGSFTVLADENTGESILTVKIVYENPGTLETLYADYHIDIVPGPDVAPADGTADYIDVTVDGRFYSHNEGYLLVSTATPLRTQAGDSAPSSGTLLFTGANTSWATYTITGIGSYSIDWFDGTNSGTITSP